MFTFRGTLNLGLKGGISIDVDSGPLRYVLKAVVVFVTSQTLLFRLALAILCAPYTFPPRLLGT